MAGEPDTAIVIGFGDPQVVGAALAARAVAQLAPRRGRALSRLSLVVAVLMGAVAALVAADQAVSASEASSCGARDIVVWLQGRGNSTAGSTYYTLALTNLSERACTLRGYPGVSAIDLTASQLGSSAGRNPHSPVRTIRIPAGGSARALVQLNDPTVFPAVTCRPATAAGLRVYLPGATEASVVPIPFGACSKQGRVYLHVSAVTS